MIIYIVNCEFNLTQTLIDCAFQKAADAEAYIDELNSDKAKAIARCKELIALRDSESMVQYLVDEYAIRFGIVAVELK
ncbi:hypothetical protein SAMN04487864_101121 [Succiniclasticum ruminis]|uniref:Uncharacterized protein n=1 Tax=Succiniclasticum ruminis TaxID=40841 RepID=A0A1G6HNV6_9FIRM|nr:hypothetical protein [Succiniclasticum ruminis]SDB95818.1 hypothetical protein SAMN04487864_101121 [Succiniclasticum ruminis]